MADAVVEFEGEFAALLSHPSATGYRAAPAPIRFVSLNPDYGIIADFSGPLGWEIRRPGTAPVLYRTVAAESGIVGKTGGAVFIEYRISAGGFLKYFLFKFLHTGFIV